MRDENPLIGLVLVFVPFSLVSVGGGPSIFAGIQHETVDQRHWLTAREFVNLFAIARAAPGPGSMLATLIGWQHAGWLGAIVATLALFVPSSLLFYAVVRVWHRHRGKAWHTALEGGLAPVGSGLILAGILAVFRVSGAGVLSYLVAFGSAGILLWQPRAHPLLLFAVGALIFMVLQPA